jgi:ribonuclease J
MAPDSLFNPIETAIDVIPLGGAGGFGMNATLYGHAGKWLLVDLGLGFAGDSLPGIDIVVPDLGFIADRRDDLVGLVLTHAHEDHLGAVPYLWPRLRCPVYATPFTAAVLRLKLVEHGLRDQVEIHEIPLSGGFSLGPFDLKYVTVTHSIPEPNMLAVTTSAGTLVHTGDWKIDPEPVVGGLMDVDGLRRLGDSGVLAMIGDSTNAMTPGHSSSEGALRDSLVELFGRYHNRVVVACFSSNVARIESISRAAAANGRRVAIVGRSLWRIIEAARETGYLKGLPDFLSGRDAAKLPRDKIVLVCTGSQGEPRSALARIAGRNHPEATLDPGDAVIFSSRPIPGNEIEIGALQNRLLRLGVEVVTGKDAFVHVSGHPAREELAQMYQWIRPATAITVHGEYAHQAAHAQLARDCQVAYSTAPANGDIIRVTADQPPMTVGAVHTGAFAIDGKRLIALDSDILKGRRRAIEQGAAVVSVVLDRKGRLLAPPRVSATGLLNPDQDRAGLEQAAEETERALEEMTGPELRDDAEVRETARLAVRRSLFALTGKKPTVDVHLLRVA